jgi:hypothetical protein
MTRPIPRRPVLGIASLIVCSTIAFADDPNGPARTQPASVVGAARRKVDQAVKLHGTKDSDRGYKLVLEAVEDLQTHLKADTTSRAWRPWTARSR